MARTAPRRAAHYNIKNRHLILYMTTKQHATASECIRDVYDVGLTVDYTDNESYRNKIRAAFRMNLDEARLRAENPTMDDADIEELLYDDAATKIAMDYIFIKTEKHPVFKELYEIAAGKLFSTDLGIGLAVLFSYDYFVFFHPCLCAFFNTPAPHTIEKTHPAVETLMKYI